MNRETAHYFGIRSLLIDDLVYVKILNSEFITEEQAFMSVQKMIDNKFCRDEDTTKYLRSSVCFVEKITREQYESQIMKFREMSRMEKAFEGQMHA